MPDPTKEEFEIARAWLEEQLKKHPGVTLRKIARIKSIPPGLWDSGSTQIKGDIPTEHSFLAIPTKDGEFVLAAIPRKSSSNTLGAGVSSTSKRLIFEPGKSIPKGLKAKVSILIDNEREAEHISKVSGHIHGQKHQLFSPGSNMFKRESSQRYLKKTPHGEILRHADTKSYIIQPFTDGMTLYNFLDSTEVTGRMMFDLAISCMQAAHDFHKKGFLHMDLHGSNIIVRETEGKIIPELIDFGRVVNIKDDVDKEYYKYEIKILGELFQYMYLELLPTEQDKFIWFEDLYTMMIEHPLDCRLDDLIEKFKDKVGIHEITLKHIIDALGETEFRKVLDKTIQEKDQTGIAYHYLLETELVKAYASAVGIDLNVFLKEYWILNILDALTDEFFAATGDPSKDKKSINEAIYNAATRHTPSSRLH